MNDRFPWHLLIWLAAIIAMFAIAVILMVQSNDCQAAQGHLRPSYTSRTGADCVRPDGTVINP